MTQHHTNDVGAHGRAPLPPYPESVSASAPYLPAPEDLFLKIIEDILGKETVLAEGWRMAVPAQASDLWLSLYKEPVDIPEQGWKLHVSANPQTAAEVLKRTLPILLAETSTFKVISSISRLVEFNFGLLGLSQIGKFITAYPRDDAHAVSLAVALDEATRGLCGPAVPSDHPLGQD